jgi:aspartyl-tRNA(Asn)/glutamyl-tRNA(Gln) amidotransferase subunit C
MATTFAGADLVKIAALSRLALTPDEVALFAQQLTDILGYVEQLQEVDTTDVPPTSHPVSAPAIWRDDEPVPSLDRDEVLAEAPAATVRTGLFKVPRVL